MTDFGGDFSSGGLNEGVAVSSLTGTFNQSVRSVGTAVTLAFIGIYLHQRGFVLKEGKRTLALISQQVTFPLFLFTKIIYCNQNWSSEPCPDVTQSLSNGWVLAIWPIYVVGCGLLVGLFVAKISQTPHKQVRSVLAACMFANSTGLPVTLLTVVHANFSETSNLGRIDPTLFLSVYLLLYPVLQWGVGGWLLTPQELPTVVDTNSVQQAAQDADQQDKTIDINESHDEDDSHHSQHLETPTHDASTQAFLQQAAKKSPTYKSNVLNNRKRQSWYKLSRRGMDETDASLYISESDLFTMFQRENERNIQFSPGGTPLTPGAVSLPPPENNTGSPLMSPYQQQQQDQLRPSSYQQHNPRYYTNVASCPQPGTVPNNNEAPNGHTPSTTSTDSNAPTKVPDLRLPFVPQANDNNAATGSSPLPSEARETSALLPVPSPQSSANGAGGASATYYSDQYSKQSSQQQQVQEPDQFDVDSFLETVQMIISRCLQPPVVGAILGICVAVTPVRGIFVDLVHRSSRAPLQWLFDGLYTAGLAAVPINMMILGCNLSASYNAKKQAREANVAQVNMLSLKTMVWIVIGKMIIMPIIGIVSCIFLRTYVLDIDDEIDGAFYLVMMIVFITPTANNVMVMVELSGSDTKEGIASCIALQYVVAPIVLSLTMSVAIGIASYWT